MMGVVRAKCCGCTEAFQASRAGSIPVARLRLPAWEAPIGLCIAGWNGCWPVERDARRRVSVVGDQDVPYAEWMAPSVGNPVASSVDRPASDSSPTFVVERFMELLRRGDVDEAVGLLGVDVEYENVGLPTIHGRERVRRLFRRGYEGGGGFDVVIHTISADGPSVLTERTDILKFRQLYIQLWVCGRFDVRDGQIVLWRDYFDYANFTMAMLRGMLGVYLPKLRAKGPSIA
jgi:limonene-1,2-epoxide hydrolase